jgi:NADH-quinone oxidoreductase subunit M
MYQKTMTGPVTDEVAATITTDLGTKEKVIAFGLVAVILVLGFAPNIALNVIQPTADALAQFVAGN